MIKIIYAARFEKQAARLEKRLQRKLAGLFGLMQENPYDPRLHTTPLSEPFAGIFAFRITRDWRVIFHFVDQGTVRILEVKHRKDIYR
jgi:mRNA-degrading endonuclease RelE of RelBE toxin-antitoxin system